jgi:hypothetical protein
LTGHTGVLHRSDWKFGHGDREIARCEVPRNFVDRGDHKSSDMAADLGTSGLKSRRVNRFGLASGENARRRDNEFVGSFGDSDFGSKIASYRHLGTSDIGKLNSECLVPRSAKGDREKFR